jgi:hypothetical protein
VSGLVPIEAEPREVVELASAAGDDARPVDVLDARTLAAGRACREVCASAVAAEPRRSPSGRANCPRYSAGWRIGGGVERPTASGTPA